MSRRAPPNPAAERAAQNQQTIKTLLKLEGNKSCADCKRNKRKSSTSASHCPIVHGLNGADMIVPHRSKMGELESGSLRVHTVCLRFREYAASVLIDSKMLWDTSGNGHAY